MAFRNKSISKQLMKSYMFLLPFIVLLLLIVAIIGSTIAHNWSDKTILSHSDDAEKLMKNGIESDYLEKIVKLGGGVATVSENGNVNNLAGVDIFHETQISREAWTHFLSKVADPANKNIYSVVYDNNDGLWLVVSIPSSIRFNTTLTFNKDSPVLMNAILFYGSLVFALFILVLLLVFLYSKKISKSFTVPLNIIRDKVNGITKEKSITLYENYNFHGEFLEVNNYIDKLVLELEKEKQLKESIEKERKQLFLDISHDLRNPLSTIRGYSELLCEKKIDVVEAEQYLKAISKNSVRASKMLEELFSYTKLESSDFHIALQKEDISEFTRIQLLNFLQLFDQNDIITKINIPNYEVIVPFDKDLMARVYSNLLCNCIEHNDSGITVEVTIVDMGDIVKIIIADNGVGISDKSAKKVFKPFFRSDESRNSESGGCGLGLAIVDKIVYKHGGSIHMESTLNQGTAFIIYLNK